MSEEKTNIEAQQAFGEAINTGTLEFEGVVAADVVDHDPAPDQGPGPQGYREMFTQMRTAFPDLHIEVEHMTATDHDVAFAYTISGTNEGPFQGNPATGRKVSVRGVQIGRFAEGKLVERWGSSDQLGIMTQLGLVEA
jgi:steroid delta-isomerase-like uncharacterized protein